MDLRRRLRDHRLQRRPGWQLLAVVIGMRRNFRQAWQTAALGAHARRAIEPHQRPLIGVTLDFPHVDDPEVSVVIPVFNQWALTRDCLASLMKNAPLGRFEVIVADDASTDETTSRLADVPHVTVVGNRSNLGFTRTANRGAAAARGRFIVFLNNDTRVLPGWLEGLLGAMDDQRIGAAGSRLLYPSGLLQEAGALVWADGSGWNIGRGSSPRRPEYAFRRDVDYCSAASLIVRTALFREIGGFDERFAPAYYEDADLCFALRSRGHRVVYEPSSTVLHLEGGTHGTERRRAAPGAHTKELQYRNQAVFAAKWADELERRLPPPTRDRRLAELRGPLRRSAPRVLVCDALIPTPDQDAGSQRMDWILRILALQSSHVTFHPLNPAEVGDYASSLRRAGVEVVAGGIEPFWRFAHRRAGFYDMVILSRPDSGARLARVRRHFPAATIVFDAPDLRFRRHERELAVTGLIGEGHPQRSRATERALVAACDVTATVTEVEAAIVRDLVPTARVVVLPTVHAPRSDQPPPFESRRGLLFIASFRHAPNADAMSYFLDEVFPRVRERLDVELVIVGASPPLELSRRAGPGVRFTGFVRDVTPVFDQARVFVSPLRFGAGMKGKNGQAMALGLPMVTTTVGAEGMDLADEQQALVRDDPAGFAAAVLRLHEDAELWQRLANNARRVAEQRWSPDAMRTRLRALLEEACGDANAEQCQGLAS
jgi:O-antigen biosynthesis protein